MAEVETAKEAERSGVARRWLKEIDAASSHEKTWRERAEKIVRRYRDDDRKSDDNTGNTARFNILYANTEVLKGVMYQKTPVPDVRRRFLDKDPIGRQAAQILQRALSYSVDAYDFDGMMTSVVEDVLLPGRGVACVKYIPTMGKTPLMEGGAPVMGPDGKPVMPVAYQEVRCDYVEWDFYRESPAKRWSKVRWIALGELMTREDLVAAFGEKGKQCVLHWSPKDQEESKYDFFKRALVWAIWEKKTKKVIFVSKGLEDEVLAEVDDPLGLEAFFPVPQPVYSICTTNNRIPVPEYVQYQDQAIELDNVTARIDALVDQLRVRGIMASTMAELDKLAKASDGEMIPVEDAAQAAMIMEKGGLEKAILFWPIEQIAGVLVHLYDQREQIKQTIYEITGIADIVRGSTKSSETLGAQELKARYANVRVAPRQKAIANFARDLFRMKAELISEKFSPEVLKLMTGPEMWMVEVEVPGPDGQPVRQKVDATQQIMEILKNDKLRGFRVDIETDSTVQPDATEEQKNRVELLGAISEFVNGMGQAVAAGQIPKDVALEFLSFGVRGFKTSPQIEEAIDRMKDAAQHDKTQPPPIPPEVQAEQIKQQAEDRRMQASQQLEGQKLQAQQAGDAQKIQAQQQADMANLEAQRVLEELRLASAERIKAMELQAQRERDAEERALKLQMHREALEVQRESARMNADAKKESAKEEV